MVELKIMLINSNIHIIMNLKYSIYLYIFILIFMYNINIRSLIYINMHNGNVFLKNNI